MEQTFQPLLFGGDINVYSVARAFHEAYGVKSICYGKFPTGPAYGSDIIDYRPCAKNEDAETFRANVAAVAAEYADKTVLVIGCGDSYVKLVAENKDAFPANCVAPYVSGELSGTLINKEKFYALCDEHGILLVADEVQSGFCRTGRMFASHYWAEAGAAPDILTTAKSIAAGLPLSAIVARSEILDAVPTGTIGGTFCGNPLACAAALETIALMEEQRLDVRAEEIGQIVRARCAKLQETYPVLGEVRGLGAMLGLELVEDPATKAPNGALVTKLVQECAQRGLLVENAGRWGQVLRFLAPLVITDEQLQAGLDILEEALAACVA